MLLKRFASRGMVSPLIKGNLGQRSISMTVPMTHLTKTSAPQKKESVLAKKPRFGSSLLQGSGLAMAGSPLFLTEFDKGMYFQEVQFVFSTQLNTMVECLFETQAGPYFLNSMLFLTVLRMGMYYGFMQPSYLWHFQERYGQQWKVGHHLYGSNLENPLKTGGK